MMIIMTISSFCCLRCRKRSPTDYGMMDSPAFDWKAEVTSDPSLDNSSGASVVSTVMQIAMQ